VALSKVDAVDDDTLQSRSSASSAMRSYSPPLAQGAKPAKPLLLSTATHRGVTDVLRATMAAIAARRASESAESRAMPAQWAPSI
jgi:hypothetical protein